MATLTSSSRQAQFLAPRRSLVIAAALLAVFAGGCSKPVEQVEEVRPVRVVKLAAGPIEVVAEFAGEVRPRVESRLGFRVGGKIVSRKVDVGTVVKRGQVLMQLDPQDLKLAQAQANAGLAAARSNLDLAEADYKRYKDLRDKNFVSQAVLDSKETAYQAARASYDQALAAYRNQSNQAGYATLESDVDGVVTAVDAEAGQVVAAGTPVVRVAQAGEKEIVIGIPEDKVDALRRFTDVRVRTWVRPDESFPGKLRELSPVADPATRTYTAKISIPDAPAEIKLGMTAYVTFAAKTRDAMIKLPLTAVVQDKQNTAVWIVEDGRVRLVPIRIGGTSGNDLLVSDGIAPGQTVVTAGVNLLRPGQKVVLLEDDPALRNAKMAEAAPAPASGASTGAAK